MEGQRKAIFVRGLDSGLWHRFRLAAMRRKLTTGELLAHILTRWLAENEPSS